MLPGLDEAGVYLGVASFLGLPIGRAPGDVEAINRTNQAREHQYTKGSLQNNSNLPFEF